MKKHLFSFFIASLLWDGLKAESNLLINEIMISNIDGYMVDYDYPDSWVEIFNPTSQNIDLQGYTLSHSSGQKDDFYFRYSTKIPAGEYVVILCDKVNNRNHTSFRLDADGGKISLINKKGETIDELEYPAMIAPQVGYGKQDNGAWQWEKVATPGTANAGLFTSQILPCPVFSNKGHVMSEPEIVSITMPDGDYPEDAKIYITFDGKEPTIESSAGLSFHLTIDSTTVIRAKIISEKAVSPQSVAQSYIFHERKTTIPIVSIVADDDYLFNAPLGLLSSDVTSNNKPNYKQDWRRPVNIEYLGVSGEPALFNQLGETAIFGGASRNMAQKSMKFYANKRFGEKRFKGVMWEEKQSVAKNKSFIMRNGGNNCYCARIDDASVQRLFGTHVQNLDYQAYSPAIMYINGKYRGIFGLRERSNEDYVFGNYNGFEDIEIATADSYYRAETEAPLFQEFSAVYHRENVTYEELAELMDVESFMNAFIAECFTVNTDYPQNNVSMWRPLENEGKWRWILKDMDFVSTGHGVDYNMFKYILGTTNQADKEYAKSVLEKTVSARYLYEKMMSYPEFRNVFLDRYSVYLGDFCKPSVTINMVSKMRDEIIDEILPTGELYNIPGLSDYDQSIAALKLFYTRRPRIVYKQMADYFSLGNVMRMTLSTHGADVKIHEVGLTEGDFDGYYFSDRELRLNSGANNVRWKMTTFAKGTMVEETDFPQSEVSIWLRDYEVCDSVAFEAIAFGKSEFEQKLESLSIDKTECTDWSTASSIYFDEPRYAFANITVDSLPVGKSEDLHAYLEFYDNNGNYLRKPILLNRQGSSGSKINLSVQFADDNWTDSGAPSLTFGSWVAQDEFHLKAFQNDGLRGVAEIAYKLYNKMIGVSEGPRMTGDAFPMSLYVNGNFYGIMCWQLKKHRKNMDFAKDNGTQVWLDGKLNDKQLFGGTVNWTKFEVRNPKDLYNMDGTDYDGDNPQEIIDATSVAYSGKTKMKRCAEAKQRILALSNYNSELSDLEANGSSVDEMKTAISARYEIESLINYVVFSLVTNNYNGFSDNWQWYTKDGVRWSVAPFDCELTFGYNDDDVSSLWPAGKSSKKYDYHMDNALSNGPMVWIKKYFWTEVSARYAELRETGVLSVENIIGLAIDWQTRIGRDTYETEFSKWSAVVNDDSERLSTWLTERFILQDEYLGYEPVLLGDITADGKIDLQDIIALSNELTNVNTNLSLSRGDMNHDGVISISDLTLLIQIAIDESIP